MSNIQKTTLKLNNNNCIQEKFYGPNAIYHGYLYREHFPERQYTPEECALELKRVSDMELGIARTFFDLSAYDEETGVWDWDNDVMKALYRWLDDMKERGIEVALNAAWWMHSHIFKNEKSPLYDKDPLKAADNYGAFVSETVHQIIELRGYTNIKYLMILTEPNDTEVDMSMHYPNQTGFEAYGAAFRAAHEHLVKDGRRHLVKLVGPNVGMHGFDTPDMMAWLAENCDECVDIYSSHTYFDFKSDIENWECYDGESSVGFKVPGYRVQQYVKLEPNTDYVMSFYAKAAEGSDTSIWQRQVFAGAFEAREIGGKLISVENGKAYGIGENTVVTIPVSELTTEWKKYTMQFNTGSKDYAYIGIYHDVIPDGETMFYDKLSLHKVGDDTELLENGSFEDEKSNAWTVFVGGIGHNGLKLQTYNAAVSVSLRLKERVPEGKEVWYDEYNTRFYNPYTDPLQGVALAEVQCAFLNTGLNANFLWSLLDQYWPQCNWDGYDGWVDGDHRWGIMPVLKRTHTPYPAYYAFTLISKYMGDVNSKIYEGDAQDSLCASYITDSKGNIGILVVNTDEAPCEASINLEKAIGKTLYRHIYTVDTVKPDDNGTIIGIDKEFKNVENSITDILPAHSVTVYTTRKD